MKYKYWLPNDKGKNGIRNGSECCDHHWSKRFRKSRIGAWIEQENLNDVHRVGAQRKLNFRENLLLKSYSEAENLVFYGVVPKGNIVDKGLRWNRGYYTTHLIDDFDNILAALIALKNNETALFADKYKALGQIK